MKMYDWINNVPSNRYEINACDQSPSYTAYWSISATGQENKQQQKQIKTYVLACQPRQGTHWSISDVQRQGRGMSHHALGQRFSLLCVVSTLKIQNVEIRVSARKKRLAPERSFVPQFWSRLCCVCSQTTCISPCFASKSRQQKDAWQDRASQKKKMRNFSIPQTAQY